MKCDVCEKREATALITMIVGGKKSMRRLCQQCVRRMQSGDAYATTMAVLATMEPAEEVTCPVCGMKAADFQRTGRVGCAMCYDAFSGVMMPLFTRISAAPKKETEDAVPEATPQNENITQIKALREDMFAAVNAEEYERAAQLRDTIRRLEAEGGEALP